MFKWFTNLFVNNKIDRMKKELAMIQEKAFKAQRKGDLSLAGKYLMEAEALETKIVEMNKKGDN